MMANAHLRTLLPFLGNALKPARPPASEPWTTTLEDPRIGPVRLTGAWTHVPGSDSLVVIVHGLGGCSESSYCHRAAQVAHNLDISSLRLSLRGADRSGEDYYHAGLTADLHAALASPDFESYRHLSILGYSLGGHVTLGAATDCRDSRLRKVAAVCSPLDLAIACRAIDRRRAWLYRSFLLKSLRQIYGEVARRREVPTPVELVQKVRHLRVWDDVTIAPRHGFRSAWDYYKRASVGPKLPALQVPALLVAARRDPLVATSAVTPWLRGAGARLRVRWVENAGHVAFPESVDLALGVESGATARSRWDTQIIRWLTTDTEER